MPKKDPEEYKAYMREQMRRRREQAKEAKAGEPPAIPGQPSQPPEDDNVISKPPSPEPAPATRNEAALGVKAQPNDSRKGASGAILQNHETPQGANYNPHQHPNVTEMFWQACGMKSVWPNYQDKDGFPCANGLGECCLPLMWGENRPVRMCNYSIEYCIYFRRTGKQGVMEFNSL